MIISEKSKKRELRHKNVVYSLKSSSREVTIAQNAYHAVQPFEEGQVLSVIVLCCFAKTKGDTVPVTYHCPKTLISQFHYIATRENSKRV